MNLLALCNSRHFEKMAQKSPIFRKNNRQDRLFLGGRDWTYRHLDRCRARDLELDSGRVSQNLSSRGNFVWVGFRLDDHVRKTGI